MGSYTIVDDADFMVCSRPPRWFRSRTVRPSINAAEGFVGTSMVRARIGWRTENFLNNQRGSRWRMNDRLAADLPWFFFPEEAGEKMTTVVFHGVRRQKTSER